MFCKHNMKSKATAVVVLLAMTTTVLGKDVEIPQSLRGGIKVDQKTISIALEMQKQGWVYVMPHPKSKQARWGNTDGRTTWWKGYWHNKKTDQYSSATSKLKDGVYVGDGTGRPGWRRGGSPGTPTKLQWLLSESGGIPPKN